MALVGNASSKRIDYLLKSAWPAFSFEFLAPRSGEEVDRLFAAAADLRDLEPTFVCITCRTGRHAQTLDLVARMQRETKTLAMAHLVCNGIEPRDARRFLTHMRENGMTNILALRGDRDADAQPKASELKHATELIEIVAANKKFCVGAACYPEGHVESPNRSVDLAYTKLKVDTGASFLITQLFFDNRYYFRFVREARAAGIEVPIVPGIMPITNAKQLPRVRQMGASVPPALEREIVARADDPQAAAQFGVAWASLQCTSLLAGGAPGIHFYTFNRSPATRAILGALRSAEPWKWAVRDEIA